MPALLILSDLHLEYPRNWRYPGVLSGRIAPGEFDVAIFAGDIAGSPAAALDFFASAPALRGKPVVYVPGNHEFYGGSIESRLADAAELELPTNIALLAPGVACFAGLRFIGATLWTDYALYDTPEQSMRVAEIGLSDHFTIATESGLRFLPTHALRLHLAERAFIASEIAKPFDGPTVVVTHHAPHRGSIHPRWADDSLTPAFVSDLEGFIERHEPDLWVHGHVHDSFDYRVGATRIVCNPRGYGGENGRFRPGLVISI